MLITRQRPRRQSAKRAAFTALEVVLVLLLAGLVFMVGFRFLSGHDRSPFALFGAAPGMSMGELRAEVVDKRHGTVDCRPEYDAYQYCLLKFSPDPGVLAALVDPGKHVIVVHGVSVVGLESLHAAADSAQTEWTRVAPGQSAPPLVEIGDTGVVRWTSPDQRWTAEQHFSGAQDPDKPTQVLLVDTRAVATLAQRSTAAAEDGKRTGWIPLSAEEEALAFERHRANRQSDFGSMATTLARLGDFETAHFNAHQSYTDNLGELQGLEVPPGTLLEILTATDSGWTAKTTRPEFAQSSCVAVGGRVARVDLPATIGGRSVTTTEGVACDPLPPAETAPDGRP